MLPQRGEHHPSIGNSARLPSSFRGASQHLQLLIGERMPRASSRGTPVVFPHLLPAELAELGRETVSAIDAAEDGLLTNSRKSSASPHCAQKKPSPHPGDLHAQDPSGSCEDGGISVHTGPDCCCAGASLADPGQPCTPSAVLLRNALSCESTWPHRKSILTVDKSMLILVNEGCSMNVCRAVLRLSCRPTACPPAFCRGSWNRSKQVCAGLCRAQQRT